MTSSVHLVIREYSGAGPDPLPSTLPAGELHIWHWKPVCPPAEAELLSNILLQDERERALRFHFPKQRNEFIINRGRLRMLLGGYLCKPPGQLVFEYSTHGKPSLRDGGALHFNLSHADGLAAVAIVRERQVGIDVEPVRRQTDTWRIAERFFSEREKRSLQGLPDDELDQAFFRCWTRKEAYVKAKGEGLSIPLHQFDVSLSSAEPAALLSTRPDPEEAKQWILYDLALQSGYAGALAVAAIPLSPKSRR